jgi:hypothetical protein
MNYIKVWCEYDINGNFGGNNNEEVLSFPDTYEEEDVNQKVSDYIVEKSGQDIEELEDLWGYEFIGVEEL